MVLATLAYTLQAQQERILEFQGLNKKSVIDDGEMRDMLNLSSDEYPCLYQRKPRAVYSDRYKKPTAMIVKDSKLAVISDGVFYYDGQEYGNEGQFSDQTCMVAINSKICFFPEKCWFSVRDTEDCSFGEFGNIEEKLDMQTSCRIDSSKVTFLSTETVVAKPDPRTIVGMGKNIKISRSTTLNRYVLTFGKSYNLSDYFEIGRAFEASGIFYMTITTTESDGSFNSTTESDIATTWKLSSGTVVDIGDNELTVNGTLSAGDGYSSISLFGKNVHSVSMDDITGELSVEGNVDIKLKPGDAVTLTVEKKPECNTSAVIEEVGGDYIKFPDDTFINIIAEGTSAVAVESGRITVERLCPDLDHVMEANNRLWGVSNADNTIYACKLGDPTNWQYYQSTALDSYAATQGTDGEWTGCAMYSSHLLFFKDDYIHRLFGNKPANYQTDTMECHALEKGSSKSLAIINDVVFYKSRVGIMAYSGGTPTLISDNFGTGKYEDAIAGTDRFKYFISLLHDGKPEFLVYDTNRMLWHKEDDLRVRSFAYHDGKLLYIAEDNYIYEIDSDKPAANNDIKWMAQFGPFDEFIENKKVYSKFKLRVKLEDLSELVVMISVDDGKWELVERIGTEKARSITIPIVPRRCNRFAIRLDGKGYCKVESLVRVYRQGRL